MTHRVEFDVNYCFECPYAQFIPELACAQESYYKCDIKEKIILVVQDADDIFLAGIDIPTWCPLPPYK